MPRKYLILFAQAHNDFRLPELDSVSELYGFTYVLSDSSQSKRPFMVIELDLQEHARLLARRCILIKLVFVLLVPLPVGFDITLEPYMNFIARVARMKNCMKQIKPIVRYGNVIFPTPLLNSL